MNFVMSYSGGKDSVLSLHRLVREGHTPMALIVMYNEEMSRSWFHGIDDALLDQISESLNIPLWKCRSGGDNYREVLSSALKRAKQGGAEFAAFGDIDIDEHREWYRSICDEAGISGKFPLWKENRENLVREVVGLGYECVIKCVGNSALDQSFLGERLTAALLEKMREKGVDLCGENGEYHTVVVDGPLFSHPVKIIKKEILDFGKISAMNIVAEI